MTGVSESASRRQQGVHVDRVAGRKGVGEDEDVVAGDSGRRVDGARRPCMKRHVARFPGSRDVDRQLLRRMVPLVADELPAELAGVAEAPRGADDPVVDRQHAGHEDVARPHGERDLPAIVDDRIVSGRRRRARTGEVVAEGDVHARRKEIADVGVHAQHLDVLPRAPVEGPRKLAHQTGHAQLTSFDDVQTAVVAQLGSHVHPKHLVVAVARRGGLEHPRVTGRRRLVVVPSTGERARQRQWSGRGTRQRRRAKRVALAHQGPGLSDLNVTPPPHRRRRSPAIVPAGLSRCSEIRVDAGMRPVPTAS